MGSGAGACRRRPIPPCPTPTSPSSTAGSPKDFPREQGDDMTTPARIRKSIDRLTAAELADYEHAFVKLKEISEADPSDIDGLQYFQDLHNTMLGPCEHANDTFMPWHRAHLFEFEEALRRSDPPRTANVTQPYWDWSAL